MGARDRRWGRGRATSSVLACAIAAATSGCSITIDGEGDPWPLTGAAVDTASLQHLTLAADRQPELLVGADGANWVAMGVDEDDSAARVHLVRLGSPALEETVETPVGRFGRLGGSWLEIGTRAIYASLERGIAIHRPGGHGPDVFVALGASGLFLGHAPSDAAFVWEDAGALHLVRTDGSYERRFERDPVGAGDWNFGWSDDGNVALLVNFPGAGSTADIVSFLCDTRSESTIELGRGPAAFYLGPERLRFLPDGRTALTCSTRPGLNALPLDGSPPTELDVECGLFPPLLDLCAPNQGPDDCGFADDAALSTLINFRRVRQSASRILYGVGPSGSAGELSGGILRTVALDGSGQTDVAHVDGPLLDVSPPHHAQATGYPVHQYAWSGAVDGRPVMSRGRQLRFSIDGTRLRFLEHTADLNGAGDLMSGPIEGPMELVARNTVNYDELPDGRLIAVTNAVYSQHRTRVVVVDEARRSVTRLVEQAVDYQLVPDADEVLVLRQKADANAANQWVRVPLPPRAP